MPSSNFHGPRTLLQLGNLAQNGNLREARSQIVVEIGRQTCTHPLQRQQMIQAISVQRYRYAPDGQYHQP